MQTYIVYYINRLQICKIQKGEKSLHFNKWRNFSIQFLKHCNYKKKRKKGKNKFKQQEFQNP